MTLLDKATEDYSIEFDNFEQICKFGARKVIMKKLFVKDEIWFAVIWIVIYVVGFSNADLFSESIGIPKLLTVLFGLVMTGILYGFIRKNHLCGYLGLCRLNGRFSSFCYFIPLIVISSVNFWNGVTINFSAEETMLYIISMCFVGFLEEVIFRGLLFKGMCKTNVTVAMIVSSLTFGMGHIVNLLLGEPVFDTLLQLIYASAIGFCYTAVFYVSGSILPCILSHVVVNSTSAFAIEPVDKIHIIITIVQTVISTGYGIWLLYKKRNA